MRGVYVSHQSLGGGVWYRSSASGDTSTEMGVTRGGGDGTIIIRPGNKVTVTDISRHGNKGRRGMAYKKSTSVHLYPRHRLLINVPRPHSASMGFGQTKSNDLL